MQGYTFLLVIASGSFFATWKTCSGMPPITNVEEAKDFCEENGLYDREHTPRDIHKAFHPIRPEGMMIAKDAMAFEQQVYDKSMREGAGDFTDMSTMISYSDLEAFHESSSYQESEVDCSRIPLVNTFRTANGTCNNLRFTTWGAREENLLRWLPPQYGGMGYKAPVTKRNGRDLPNARLISVKLHPDVGVEDNDHSYMLMQWGQFLDHDFSISPETPEDPEHEEGEEDECENCATNSERCFNIPISPDDPLYGVGNPATDPRFRRECLPFIRSAPTSRQCRGKGLFPREQFNELTAYIDASNVYGSDDGLAEELREGVDGRLLLASGGADVETPILPFAADIGPPCMGTLPICFLAGDVRVSEQIFLTTMHTLWVVEHNRIVTILERLNPSWDDERLYQEGRKIVGALHQVIVYNEYTPELLGRYVFDTLVPKYRGYDDFVNAGILNSFAHAAYRMGHSQLRNNLARIDDNYETLSEIRFRDAFFQPSRYFLETDASFPNYLRGLLDRQSQQIDRFISGELTGHLFAPVDRAGNQIASGFDLAAFNIQRGRDHGLPGYLGFRTVALLRLCYLGVEFTQPIITDENLVLINQVYGEPGKHNGLQNCDLWPCGLLEERLELQFPPSKRTGGQLGPTLSVIVADQFTRSRDGDRFYYENPGIFTESQVAALKATSFAAVICANAEISTIQPSAFRWDTNGNERISCDSVQEDNCLDLSPWQDPPCEDQWHDYFCQLLNQLGGCTVGSYYDEALDVVANCRKTCTGCGLAKICV